VSNVDKATGYFTISYEDGDDEELQRDELQKLLAKSAKLPPAAAAAAPPRSGITAKEFASATLHDFMRNTSSAARRKRKHTDLVRRGVFKERAAKERAKEARAYMWRVRPQATRRTGRGEPKLRAAWGTAWRWRPSPESQLGLGLGRPLTVGRSLSHVARPLPRLHVPRPTP
jgi:hypothetical protein